MTLIRRNQTLPGFSSIFKRLFYIPTGVTSLLRNYSQPNTTFTLCQY